MSVTQILLSLSKIGGAARCLILAVILLPLTFVAAVGMALAVHAAGWDVCVVTHRPVACFWGNDIVSHFFEDFSVLFRRWCAERSLSPLSIWPICAAVSALWTRLGIKMYDQHIQPSL